ncbi:unnamed protein product [Microthlaspi erraticum]|uniref:Uncharacterized protein n=1 Tax=Microthlaspi erraticum TaxID=1685480 RepID=A0A6D2JU90_9BRAS|nr:unnamed protein product [Microthlaspi erraticum]
MDEAYKMRKDWYHHEGPCPELGYNANKWNDEILRLYKAAEYLDEDMTYKDIDLGELAEGEDKREHKFLAKLADAEMPLYQAAPIIASCLLLFLYSGLRHKMGGPTRASTTCLKHSLTCYQRIMSFIHQLMM